MIFAELTLIRIAPPVFESEKGNKQIIRTFVFTKKFLEVSVFSFSNLFDHKNK